MTHLLLGTPCSTNQFCGEYVRSIGQMPGELAPHGIRFSLSVETRSPDIARARNMICRQFLAGDYTHLLFVDADQGWRPHDVIRMLSHDLPIVAGAVPRKSDTATGWGQYVGNLIEPIGERPYLIEASHAGTGFMLIQREALERLSGLPMYSVTDGEERCYFLPELREMNGKLAMVSEDYTFSEKYREAGGKIWIDTMCEVQHVGSKKWEKPSMFAAIKGLYL